ncbi:MAG: ankyrin repeat domain-containing protein, partial [Planctomycetota bacterium]
ALLLASVAGEVDAVEALLEAGVDPDRTQDDVAPLMAAAAKGQDDVVDLLLAAGADPSLRDEDDWTAADFADAGGHLWLASRLARAEKEWTARNVTARGS